MLFAWLLLISTKLLEFGMQGKAFGRSRSKRKAGRGGKAGRQKLRFFSDLT